MEPTEEDIYSPEFEAIWKVIKGWDIQRVEGAGYAGATGTDVMAILTAVREAKKYKSDLTFFRKCNFRLGYYNIGTTKVLMLGTIRVFVSKD